MFFRVREILCVRVVESRFGRERNRVEELIVEGVRRRWSFWWKDIMKVTQGEEGEWFRGRVSREI